MKIQASSKELKNCIKCDDFISRTERRYVDGCLHHHLNCGDKPKPDIGWVTRSLGRLYKLIK